LSGGGLLVIGDDEPWYYTSLTSFAGLTWSRGGMSGITTDIAAHPATEGVTSVYFAGVSSQISVGFPATDLIRDQEGNTMLAASEAGSGKALAIADEDSINNDYVLSVDNLRLANAIIDWIASPRSEHELAVSLVVPASLERASALLNATVANRGLRNETDVYLYLIINGTTVGSATIPELLVNELYDFSFEWAPTKAGVYNITAYATIVPGESYAGNNIITKWSDVSARLLGDLNGDGIVNIQDVVLVSGIYGSTIGEPNWNFQADVAAPYGRIDIFDLVTVTAHYGHYI
jgi:hypothetical protein